MRAVDSMATWSKVSYDVTKDVPADGHGALHTVASATASPAMFLMTRAYHEFIAWRAAR